MPVKNGIGSSMATPDKQQGLSKLLSMHMAICSNIFKKYPKKPQSYFYIDAYCGDGAPHEGVDASPKIFIDLLKNSNLKKLSAWFIDKNQANIDALKARFPIKGINIVCADSTAYVQDIARSYVRSNSLGLLYIDPNNTPDIPMLKECSTLMQSIDFLIRFNSTAGKRIINDKIRITSILDSVDKKFWLIRRPMKGDRWQWTFLFGTNFPDLKEWKNEGFFLTNSDKGKDLINHFEYTNSEKKQLGIVKKPLGIVKKKTDINVKIESYNIFEEAK